MEWSCPLWCCPSARVHSLLYLTPPLQMGKLKPRSLPSDGGACLSNWVSIEILPHSAPRAQRLGLLICDFYHHLTPSKVGGKGEQPTGIYVNCTVSPTMCCAYRYMLQYIVSSTQHPSNVGFMGSILQMSSERKRDLPMVTQEAFGGGLSAPWKGSCMSAEPAGFRLNPRSQHLAQ